MGKKEEAGAFFTGFLVGGLIGAATALLLAPQSGEETRMQIHDKSIELKEKAEVTYAETQKKLEATTADLQKKFEELKAEAQKKFEELSAQVQKAVKKAEDTEMAAESDEA
ncbi:MAG: YtxH domain-containing protein [Anaerolineae bacterium]|nr:YtxH domain-containing protein [Anaerolineae bacterium]